MQKKIIIMGAAGRDFHNFNVCFRNNPNYRVMAFTAAQIPGIHHRTYPPELAGQAYPKGILIYPEEDLPKLIKKIKIGGVLFAYSDISNQDLMHKASTILACGADFSLIGLKSTMLKSKALVVSICAARTGSGKSQTARQIAKILKEKGERTVVVRHPMPYGDLKKQIVQRFANLQDLDTNKCTIEEREEYEPHIESGNIVFAGVDYQQVLRKAEKEADIIIWDGGNNDTPFLKPNLHIVVADAHRPGHELTYYPSEINLRMANVVIINKIDTAEPAKLEQVKTNIKSVNQKALLLEAASPITVDNPKLIKNKRALVIEDGPSTTHGNMPSGAGTIAAKKYKAKEIIDPKPYAFGSIKETYERYPHIGKVLPAIGYNLKQITELKDTIDEIPCDVIVIGTPFNLARIISLNKPAVRVKYDLQILGPISLEKVVDDFLKSHQKTKPNTKNPRKTKSWAKHFKRHPESTIS